VKEKKGRASPFRSRCPFPSSPSPDREAPLLGDLNFYGKAGVQFYTQIKNLRTARWKETTPTATVSTSMPTSSEKYDAEKLGVWFRR